MGFINKRGVTLAQDNAAIHENSIRTRSMSDRDQLMHRIDARHELGGIGRTDHNVGALSGFQTANEMRKAKLPIRPGGVSPRKRPSRRAANLFDHRIGRHRRAIYGPLRHQCGTLG